MDTIHLCKLIEYCVLMCERVKLAKIHFKSAYLRGPHSWRPRLQRPCCTSNTIYILGLTFLQYPYSIVHTQMNKVMAFLREACHISQACLYTRCLVRLKTKVSQSNLDRFFKLQLFQGLYRYIDYLFQIGFNPIPNRCCHII